MPFRELRTSRCGLILYRDDGVVWDDYLHHRQLGLPPEADPALRFFRQWRDPGVAPNSISPALISLLHSADILIERGSSLDHAESAMTEAWRPWSPITMAYHQSSTFKTDEKFLSQEQSDQLLREKVKSDPPPSVHYSHPRATTTVPLVDTSSSPKADDDFWHLLRQRRSAREYGSTPVDFSAISHLLREIAVPAWFSHKSQTALKVVPSGGGRHPTELYLYSRDISGLEPGVYHMNTQTVSLEKLSGPVDPSMLMSACGEQLWTAGAQALLFYTSRIDRNQWKYTHSRSYRVLHYDVGHVAQTVALGLVNLGLVSTFTAALRDDLVTQILRIEYAGELVMGCTVIGTPAIEAHTA